MYMGDVDSTLFDEAYHLLWASSHLWDKMEIKCMGFLQAYFPLHNPILTHINHVITDPSESRWEFSTFPKVCSQIFSSQYIHITTSEKQPPLVPGVPDAVEAQKTLELQKLRQAKWHRGGEFFKNGV